MEPYVESRTLKLVIDLKMIVNKEPFKKLDFRHFFKAPRQNKIFPTGESQDFVVFIFYLS